MSCRRYPPPQDPRRHRAAWLTQRLCRCKLPNTAVSRRTPRPGHRRQESQCRRAGHFPRLCSRTLLPRRVRRRSYRNCPPRTGCAEHEHQQGGSTTAVLPARHHACRFRFRHPASMTADTSDETPFTPPPCPGLPDRSLRLVLEFRPCLRPLQTSRRTGGLFGIVAIIVAATSVGTSLDRGRDCDRIVSLTLRKVELRPVRSKPPTLARTFAVEGNGAHQALLPSSPAALPVRSRRHHARSALFQALGHKRVSQDGQEAQDCLHRVTGAPAHASSLTAAATISCAFMPKTVILGRPRDVMRLLACCHTRSRQRCGPDARARTERVAQVHRILTTPSFLMPERVPLPHRRRLRPATTAPRY